mmetsp:Transcript_25112/g.53484  ORF Transcript_25112/g.53484 Transcript_25112/m.53484 type:complete len:104 (+) Transcript_25112:96-407(+)
MTTIDRTLTRLAVVDQSAKGGSNRILDMLDVMTGFDEIIDFTPDSPPESAADARSTGSAASVGDEIWAVTSELPSMPKPRKQGVFSKVTKCLPGFRRGPEVRM